MLKAEARGAMVMAVVRLEGGHTGATHMSHQQNTGRGSESTAFTSKLLSQKQMAVLPGEDARVLPSPISDCHNKGSYK